MKNTYIIMILILAGCGQAPSLPSTSGGTSSSGSSSSSSSSASAPAAAEVAAEPSIPNLDGSYHFVHTTCGAVVTYPVPITHTIVLSGLTLDVYDVITGCDATLRQTIHYSLTYDDESFSIAPVYTKTYTPATCNAPTTTNHGVLNWSTTTYVVNGSFLALVNLNNCDGNGNHTVNLYQKY